MTLAATSYYDTVSNLTVAQLLLKYLELEETTVLFGIPGAAVLALLSELRAQRDTFKYYICRQETGAAYIAEGYARVTGKLGVVLVTSGPGATNALTGTMNAQNNNTALLTISGEVPEKYFGRSYLQEGVDASLDIDSIYRNAVQYSVLVTNPANFQTLFTQALRSALSIPNRAAHISLPNDIAGSPVGDVQFPKSPRNYRAVPDVGNPARVQKAFEALIEARRPLILLGNGCRRALQSERLDMFAAFVEKFAIPVMTTPDGKGVFPESHPLSLRNYGLAGCQWSSQYILPSYDALLVMGSSLGELATIPNDKWSPYDPQLVPAGPFIQIDLDQSVIGRGFPIELGIVAEVGNAIDQLFSLSQSTEPDEPAVEERRAFIEGFKAKVSPYRNPERRDSPATPILPETLMTIISESIPPQTHLFIDCANSVGWSLHYLTIDAPTQIHNSLAMGPMGFGVCSVIGGKLGDPEAACVAIVGDGAMMMHGGEIAMAAHYGVGAVWIVLNDNDLAMVSQGMAEFVPIPGEPDAWKDYYAIGTPDLAKFAEGLGAEAYTATSPQEVRKYLPRALKRAAAQKKPQVLVVHINTDEVPPYYPAKEPSFM